MEATPDCGGVCAEVVIDTETEQAQESWGAWLVTMMQYYEYKQTIAYFKVFEGWGGFVQALPGCYSMYRYEALKGQPLNEFFKLINSAQEPTCWEANEYLVEDRLLTNNVYYQKGAGYRTDYCVGAPAFTDAPNDLESLMKQRRRWSNGFLFGELTTLLNVHNVLGFNGQTHSIVQRLKMLIYVPILVVNKAMGWINPAIMLTQMKYMCVYAAQGYCDTPAFKAAHPDAWRFFTNDPASMGFQSAVNLSLLFLMTLAVLASIGAQIKDSMGYFKVVLGALQVYTLFSQVGTFAMIRHFGLRDASGEINVLLVNAALMWAVLFCPFFFKPLDFLANPMKYTVGLVCYYLSYFWWYVIITVYAMCNLDDVTWGNRPSNSSKGMNVVVDNEKRQEILRQSYRSTRTNILIAWLIANVSLMFLIDCLVLSAVHNGNAALRATCQTFIKGWAFYCCVNCVLVLGLSGIHHFTGFVSQLICSKYTPAAIKARKTISSDPEAKVLLDDTEEEEAYIPPVVLNKKKAASSKKGKSDFETDEDPSFFSDDLESH